MSNDAMLSENPFNEEARAIVRQQVFDKVSYFVADLFENGITPIFVFDGTSVPEKTSGARERRKAARDSISAKICALRSQILETEPLFRKAQDFAALRALMKQQPPVNPIQDLPLLRGFITSNLGCPTITAPDEAEKLCAVLAARGIAAASYTTDTDSYAFGAPLVITGYDHPTTRVVGRDRPTHFKCVLTPLILSGLGLSLCQFVDLCIMFGCDFNNHIPNVGPAKSWKLIEAAKKNGGSRLIEIAAADNPAIDWDVLNAERCREIFLDTVECERVLATLQSRALEIDKKSVSSSVALAALERGIDYDVAENVSFYPEMISGVERCKRAIDAAKDYEPLHFSI
jgi:flap endonuclease-1